MKSRILPFLALFLSFVGFVAQVPQALANSADAKIQLMKSPDFARAKGEAKFRDRRGEQEFQVEVEVSPRLAGTVFTVTVNDAEVGELTIDTTGEGRLELNSDLGDVVPAIVRGSVVKVLTDAGVVVLSGQF